MGEGSVDPRATLVASYAEARSAGDTEAMAEAALSLARLAHFGPPAGRTPALLFEALEATDDPRTKVRIAAALARTWVYANDASRGLPFADDAVVRAEQLDDPALLADALDAQLAARWGPDDLSERLHVSARLEDVAVHVDDVDARLRAYLWRLTTAMENLDIVGVRRQLAALDLLAEETTAPTVRFFAISRRAMHALLVGDTTRARQLLETVHELGAAGAVPDAYAIDRALSAEIARQRHDVDTLLREAELFESYGIAQAVPSIVAEAAVLWLEAGETSRAAHLVAATDASTLPRDVDWTLTVCKTLQAAVGVGDLDAVRDIAPRLAPYTGRGVVNAGAVNFQGVVEDYLGGAAAALADDAAGDLRARAATAYRRLGAIWWLGRVAPQPSRSPAAADRATWRLHPTANGDTWAVGAAGSVVADMKGLHYLRILLERPGVDVTAADLVAAVNGHGALPASDAGDQIDGRALAAYRQRLRDLDEQIADAADDEQVARLDAERDALLDELRRATGLGGRTRRAGSSDERARVSVRKAIAAALDRLDECDPPLVRLLRRSVRTGSTCVYAPDPDDRVTWQLTAR